MNTPDFNAAAAFIAANARVLDRRRFQRLFEDGPVAPVRDAVAAYRNDDGGFGHALEPDCRAPGSQPAAAEMALRVMDETDAWDEGLVRAREVFSRVGPLIIERNLVALDPEAPGEVHGVLDFAPEPDSLARSLFDDVTVKAHLDHLAQAQLEDGGWTFNWPSWSPAAERDWRGFLTVDALRVLRTNGRL
jgi:hypothetical protein